MPLDGLVLMSESIDSLGLFTQDVKGMELAAGSVIEGWRRAGTGPKPILAVPEGEFMGHLSAEAREAFAAQCSRLKEAGYSVLQAGVPWDERAEDVFRRMIDLLRGEMARYHQAWYESYADRYGPDTTKAIHTGRAIPEGRLAELRSDREELREKLKVKMEGAGIDLWITPSSWGLLPRGLLSPGLPA